MTYMGWMMTDMKKPVLDNVLVALEYYEKKFGRVPNVLEYGTQLVVDDLHVPELEGIALRQNRMPKNILYIGVDDEKTA